MQTIRQAFILLRQNPLLSTIFILGTAFAITMIMAIVITWQMKYADIEPEVNRNRSLYISKMHLQGKENKNWNNYTACSPAFMKNCVQPLPEVEACTAFVPATVALVSMPDGTNAVKVDGNTYWFAVKDARSNNGTLFGTRDRHISLLLDFGDIKAVGVESIVSESHL